MGFFVKVNHREASYKILNKIYNDMCLKKMYNPAHFMAFLSNSNDTRVNVLQRNRTTKIYNSKMSGRLRTWTDFNMILNRR